MFNWLKKLFYKEENKQTTKNSDDDIKLYNKYQILLQNIKNDFMHSPFNDKWETKLDKDNVLFFKYKMDNGDVINITYYHDKKVEFVYRLGGVSSDISSTFSVILGDLGTCGNIFTMLKWINNSSMCRFVTKPTNQPVENKATENPLKDKYNLIVRKIKLRQEEINKLDKNAAQRESLVNELNIYKKKADELRKQFT